MKINLYHPQTGEARRIHHHDVDGWIADGWLTAMPEIQVAEPAIESKKKTKPTSTESE